MNINKNIKDLHEMLIKKEIVPNDLVDESINKMQKLQDKCNSFVTIIDSPKITDVNDNLLSGIPFGVKDNFSTKDVLSTGSSNTLSNYVPFFTATAVSNLEKKGAIMVSKCALDEFGMGGTGTTGHTGIQKNPWDIERICGGSSSGSAASVAAGCYPFALGSDTGDSVRKPAAYCGIVGYKPTYGMVSRYGLFPFASSLDTCGVLARSVEDAAIVVDAMKGIDPKDQTTWDSNSINLYEATKKELKPKRMFYIKELLDINNYENQSSELKENFANFFETIAKLKDKIEVEEVSIEKELLLAINPVYNCISCAEATSNMSNLTGISFGKRKDGEDIMAIMKNYRSDGFSPLIKRRFVIGSYILQQENQEKYFVNAMRVRRIIVDKFNDLFNKYDALIMPAATNVAPLIKSISNTINTSFDNVLDNYLQIANFGGYPSITIPSGFINDLPIAINITTKCYMDEELINIATFIESKLGYKNIIAKGWDNE